MAGGLHSTDVHLELKREVSSWEKNEVYAKETLTYHFEERKKGRKLLSLQQRRRLVSVKKKRHSFA